MADTVINKNDINSIITENIMIHNILSIIHISLRYTIYFVSKFTRRKKNLWLFGSGFGYADNVKYLFERVKEYNPEIHSVWISKTKEEALQLRQKGVEAYYCFSLCGYIKGLTAGVYIYSHRTCDINYYTSSGKVVKFDLWHGVAMKQIEYTITSGAMRKAFDGSFKSRFYAPYNYQKPDLLLSPGDKCDKVFEDSFLVDKSHIVHSTYPRCWQFLDSRDQQIERIQRLGGIYSELYDIIKAHKKTYIYMPTFRDSHGDFLSDAGFDFRLLNEALKKNDSLFILKVHPSTFKYLKNVNDYSNIYVVKKQCDIYPILPFVNTLITDYSSIYFDFLLLKSEVILFPFDIDSYRKNDRPFIINYDDDIKGKRVYSFNELIENISNAVDCHLTDVEYDQMREWFSSSDSADLIELLKGKLKL